MLFVLLLIMLLLLTLQNSCHTGVQIVYIEAPQKAPQGRSGEQNIGFM